MKKNETRQRLLHIGLDLISVHGLSGITLGLLASESGLSKSGLFAHFGSKEQLQIDLLDEMVRAARRVIVDPAMQVPEGLPRLTAVVERWFGWPARADLRGGCPVAAALFELDDVESEVRAHAAALEAQWRETLDELVMEARWHGHFRRDTDAGQFVWELFGIYLSHHVSTRFLKAEDADARARTAYAVLVERHRAPGGCAGKGTVLPDAEAREDAGDSEDDRGRNR